MTDLVPLDPVFSEDGYWYHWDETWSYEYGPYISEEVAREKLDIYCKILNGEQND